MKNSELFALISSTYQFDAVRKDRHDENGDLRAWYYQAEENTFAFAILEGSHGKREDIPADRTYFITSGKGVFVIDDQEVEVARGSIVTIAKNSTYDFRSVGNKPLEFFVDVGFKLDLDSIPS